MKRWTFEERAELKRRLGQGQSVAQIATALNRSASAVWCTIYRLHWQREVRFMDGLCVTVVARMFSIEKETAIRWIREGKLRARKVLKSHCRYRIEYDDILLFLENSDYWMEWTPHQIKDKTLHQYATELRQTGAWDWLSAPEFAARIQVEYCTLLAQLKQGIYPEARLVNNRWWIPSPAVIRVLTEYAERITPSQAARLSGTTIRTIWERCNRGYYTSATKVRFRWYIDRTEVLLKAQQKQVQ